MNFWTLLNLLCLWHVGSRKGVYSYWTLVNLFLFLLFLLFKKKGVPPVLTSEELSQVFRCFPVFYWFLMMGWGETPAWKRGLRNSSPQK